LQRFGPSWVLRLRTAGLLIQFGDLALREWPQQVTIVRWVQEGQGIRYPLRAYATHSACQNSVQKYGRYDALSIIFE
jgi:hypothetical protein